MSAMPSTGALQAKRHREVHSPFRNDGDEAQRKMQSYRFASPQKVESKYTEPQRTSSSSYKPPMLRDAYKKPTLPEPPTQQPLSISSALHYFKNVFTGRSASQTTSTVVNKVNNSTTISKKVFEKLPEQVGKEPPKVAEKEENTAEKEKDEGNKETKETPAKQETTDEVKSETPPPVVIPAPKSDAQNANPQNKKDPVSERPHRRKPQVPFSYDPKKLRSASSGNDIPSQMTNKHHYLPPTMLVPTQINEFSIDNQWEARMRKIEQFRRNHSIIPPTVMEPDTLPMSMSTSPKEHADRPGSPKNNEFIFPPKEIKSRMMNKNKPYASNNISSKNKGNQDDKKAMNYKVDRQRSNHNMPAKRGMTSPNRSDQKHSVPLNAPTDNTKATVQMSDVGGITSFRATSSPVRKYSSTDTSHVTNQNSETDIRRSPLVGRESSVQKGRIRSKSTPDKRTGYLPKSENVNSGGKQAKRTKSAVPSKDTRSQNSLLDDRDAPMIYAKQAPRISPRVHHSKKATESFPSLSAKQIKSTSPTPQKRHRMKSPERGQHLGPSHRPSPTFKNSVSPRNSFSNIHQSPPFPERPVSPASQSRVDVFELMSPTTKPRPDSTQKLSPFRQSSATEVKPQSATRISPRNSATNLRPSSPSAQGSLSNEILSAAPIRLSKPDTSPDKDRSTKPSEQPISSNHRSPRRAMAKSSSPKRSQIPNQILNASRNKSSTKVTSPIRSYGASWSRTELHPQSPVRPTEDVNRGSLSNSLSSQLHGDSSAKRVTTKGYGLPEADKKIKQKPAKQSASSRTQYRAKHDVQMAKSESSHFATRDQRPDSVYKNQPHTKHQLHTSSSLKNQGPSRQQVNSAWTQKPTVISEQSSQALSSPKSQRSNKQLGSSAWPLKPTVVGEEPSLDNKQERNSTWQAKPTIIKEQSSQPPLSPKSQRSYKQLGVSTWQHRPTIIREKSSQALSPKSKRSNKQGSSTKPLKPSVVSPKWSQTMLSPNSQRSNEQQVASTRTHIMKPTVLSPQSSQTMLSPNSQSSNEQQVASTRTYIMKPTVISPQSSQTILSPNSQRSKKQLMKPTVISPQSSQTKLSPKSQLNSKQQANSTRTSMMKPTVISPKTSQTILSSNSQRSNKQQRTTSRPHVMKPTVISPQPSQTILSPKSQRSRKQQGSSPWPQKSPKISEQPKSQSTAKHWSPTRTQKPTVINEEPSQESLSPRPQRSNNHLPQRQRSSDSLSEQRWRLDSPQPVESKTKQGQESTSKSPARSPLRPPNRSPTNSPPRPSLRSPPRSPLSSPAPLRPSSSPNVSPTISATQQEEAPKQRSPWVSFHAPELPNSDDNALDKSPSMKSLSPSIGSTERTSSDAVMDRLEAMSISPLTLESLHFKTHSTKEGLPSKLNTAMMNNSNDVNERTCNAKQIVPSKVPNLKGSTSQSDTTGPVSPDKLDRTKFPVRDGRIEPKFIGGKITSIFVEQNKSNSASSHLAHNSCLLSLEDQNIFTTSPIVDNLNMDFWPETDFSNNSSLCNTSEELKNKRQLYKGMLDEQVSPVTGHLFQENQRFYPKRESQFGEVERDSPILVTTTSRSTESATGHSSALVKAIHISDEAAGPKPQGWPLRNSGTKTTPKYVSPERKAKEKYMQRIQEYSKTKSASTESASHQEKPNSKPVSSFGASIANASGKMADNLQNVEETVHEIPSQQLEVSTTSRNTGESFSEILDLSNSVMSFFSSIFTRKETSTASSSIQSSSTQSSSIQSSSIQSSSIVQERGAENQTESDVKTMTSTAKREYSLYGMRHSTFQESLKVAHPMTPEIDTDTVEDDDLLIPEKTVEGLFKSNSYADHKSGGTDHSSDRQESAPPSFFFDDSLRDFASSATMRGEIP